MKYGIVKVAAVTPTVKVGDPSANADTIAKLIKKLGKAGAEIVVFPELCVTGYTCADLFFTRELRDGAIAAVKKIAAAVPENMLVFVGAPIEYKCRLYNCAVAMSAGETLGIVPKTELPDYDEFYEKRYFATPDPELFGVIPELDEAIASKFLFRCSTDPRLVVACEICEDMWHDVPPSVAATRAGATVICNLSASDEVVGKAEYRRLLVAAASGKQRCGYVYADAGKGESVTDVVFSGHNVIAENGDILTESEPFGSGVAVYDIDVEKLSVERMRKGAPVESDNDFSVAEFALSDGIKLDRRVEKYPFIPRDDSRAELILTMQATALRSRFDAIKADKAVLGVSGGLDSSLALLVCARALDKKNILAVTIPAFGTTAKTKSNAQKLCEALGVEMTTVDIKDTVTSHLRDIGHDKTDVVYENAQARTRTMTLFDVANKVNGLVVGTGDLSELALGWCTYNGDHMSSYGVNAGVPKTLVKHLVRYEADRLKGDAKNALYDVLGTDISPELLPPEDGKIAQKTEDILGAYDLHDFIIYYHVRFGFARQKIEFLLKTAFPDAAESELKKALDVFYKRFNMSQFKRSCMPDGVKIGSVSLSPRSSFRLPSDL